MSRPSFSRVWERIAAHQGQPFALKKGEPFTYALKGNSVSTTRTQKEYLVPISSFEKAYARVPYPGPGQLDQAIQGPSYVWAILHDARIRASDW